MQDDNEIGALDAYVPRVLLSRLVSCPDEQVLSLDGTVVFVDISGFTRLSERLARTGREGAEHLSDAINSCFSALLADAYMNGGALLKFGGDALLLWFEGEEHASRACASACAMRSTLRSVGRIRTGASEIVLRMSVGVHTGTYETFLVGDSHREYLIGGPAASRVVEMEGAASAGQILLSPETARALPKRSLGQVCGPGVLLARSPVLRSFAPPETVGRPADDVVARCLSTVVRAHVMSAPAAPEHRTASVAFIQFGQLDELIIQAGPAAAADALHALVKTAQEAADLFQVCLLGTDVTAGGGKLILTAGAPRALGDDEERMLLTVRHIVETVPERLPIRVGVNRGQVFAGEIGPHYRRTYTVMGDTVNLAARLMAKAPWGSIYATEGVLERSQTRFELRELPPFMVKGKEKPVEAWEVGGIMRPVEAPPDKRLPLIGRERELGVLREAIAGARAGKGALVEIVGETGTGKSRLLTEARALASGMTFVHSTCETYTQTIPYVGWRDPLRQVLGLTWEDPGQLVLRRLQSQLEATQPDLVPWLPLLAIALDAEAPPTPEVQALSDDARAPKLHEVVRRFLAPALSVPTLVQIEHGHLMDEASSALLTTLTEHLVDSSWVVMVTRRDAEDGFVAPPGASRIELGPLPRDQALALAEATPEADQLPPHVLELAVERSGGSPEFLLDLLVAAVGGSETLPDSVDSAANARIDALAPADRVLVRRAAVLGLSFHVRRLRDVLDDGIGEPDETTWRRLSFVFAHDPDGRVRFKRPALREAAYEGLPFRLRRQLHTAVARSLEREIGRDVDADPAALSLHFTFAGDHSRTWKYAMMAAGRAGRRFANADAARLYRRAIAAGQASGRPAPELAAAWEALADALRRAGEPTEASKALTAARRLVPEDRLGQARLLHRHAQIAERRERLRVAVRWVNRGMRALEELEDVEAVAARARLVAMLAAIRQRQGRSAEAVDLCQFAIAQAEASGAARALARACYTLDWALHECGRDAEAKHSARALEIYQHLGDAEEESGVLNNLGMFAYFRWDWDEAVELYRRGGVCCERAGKPADAAYTDCNIGEILSDQGRLEEAEGYLRRARRVWRGTGDRQGVAFADVLLGRLAVRDRRFEEGLELLGGGASALRSFGLDAYAEFARLLVGEGEAFGGDPRRALSIIDEPRAPADRYVPLGHRVRGIALARLGDSDAGIVALEESLAAARSRGALYDLATALDALDAIGILDDEGRQERDSLVRQLHIEAVPQPWLQPGEVLAAGARAALAG